MSEGPFDAHTMAVNYAKAHLATHPPGEGCTPLCDLSNQVLWLTKRRDDLLATVVKVSQTTPFPDEWKDWESQRAALVAEVGTQKARVAELEAEQASINGILAKVNAALNDAGVHCALYYWEAIREIAKERDALKARVRDLELQPTELPTREQLRLSLLEACEQAEDLLDELEEKRIRTATSVRAQERISELRKLATP